MGVLSNGQLTLADWVKRTTPQGGIDTKIAEVLSQTNEILDDAVFVQGNLPTGHRVTIRTGLPPVYWRANNAGVPRSKSTTAQVDESCGMLEAYAAIDKDEAELNGTSAELRFTEETAFIESMGQQQANTMFYGDPRIDPRQYLGLAARYSTISGAANGQNIIDGLNGSVRTGNSFTSIWLVGWGENTVFCTFPKGSKSGLLVEDDGLLTIYDANGNPYKAYQSHYQWKNGLVVKDWRYAVRIANIDVTALTTETGSADIIKLMSRAMDRLPSQGMCRPSFYMNRTVYSMLRIQALNKSQNALSVESGLNQFGQASKWLDFQGVPVRKVDALTLEPKIT